ncbi:MAG TPA: hypothetical protein DCS87_11745 [Rheinheimera sp.]|nr:hypothetical protein [Rheinheimera sp.]
MTLKEVRQALRRWGRFWSEKENGLGFASRSITATMMEVGVLGVSSRSDKHLYSHGADGIFVPDYIAEIDKVISKYLVPEERVLLRSVYVQGAQLTDKGEKAILKVETTLSIFL